MDFTLPLRDVAGGAKLRTSRSAVSVENATIQGAFMPVMTLPVVASDHSAIHEVSEIRAIMLKLHSLHIDCPTPFVAIQPSQRVSKTGQF